MFVCMRAYDHTRTKTEHHNASFIRVKVKCPNLENKAISSSIYNRMIIL